MKLIARSTVLAAVAGALLFSAACGMQDTPAQQATPPTLPPATESPASASPSVDTDGKLVDFGPDGVFIDSADDAAKLARTPADFQQFIVDSVAKIERPPGTDCEIGITVELYDPTGFASGAVNECGGYHAIWGRKDGMWKELMGMQSVPLCSDLRKAEIPKTLIDTCLDDTKRPMDDIPYTG